MELIIFGMICIYILKILDSMDHYSCRKDMFYDNFSFLSMNGANNIGMICIYILKLWIRWIVTIVEKILSYENFSFLSAMKAEWS